MNNRKFIITHGITDTEVFPVYETLKYKWEKNDNELNFTKSLENITFVIKGRDDKA